MTFITQLVLYLHLVVGLAMMASPAMFAELVSNRPSLTEFAVIRTGAKQQEMLYLYERMAASFQVFLGLAGAVSGVENWYTSLALAVYDGYHAFELYQYRERGPSHIEHMDEIIAAYAFGAAVGVVGFLMKFRKAIKIDTAVRDGGIIDKLQNMLAPTTFSLEIMLAFPFIVNLFDVASAAYQKSLLKDGKLLLELECHRILIGFIAATIITVGSTYARDLRIQVCYMFTHLLLALSFARLLTALQTPGHFETPTFLHFAVAFSSTLNFVRSVRNRDYPAPQRLEQQQPADAGARPKQE
jgi:hypothetical protein